jgi:hypothetical protein
MLFDLLLERLSKVDLSPRLKRIQLFVAFGLMSSHSTLVEFSEFQAFSEHHERGISQSGRGIENWWDYSCITYEHNVKFGKIPPYRFDNVDHWNPDLSFHSENSSSFRAHPNPFFVSTMCRIPHSIMLSICPPQHISVHPGNVRYIFLSLINTSKSCQLPLLTHLQTQNWMYSFANRLDHFTFVTGSNSVLYFRRDTPLCHFEPLASKLRPIHLSSRSFSSLHFYDINWYCTTNFGSDWWFPHR